MLPRRKILIWVFVLPFLGYLGICGYMYAMQREFMYLPRQTRVPAEATDYAVTSNGVTLRGWVVNPGRPKAMLYFGGNAESVEWNRGEFAQWFPDRTSYLIAYRGYGASEGTPDEQALYADAVAIYDQVRRNHPGAPIAVIGRSLGSGVASYLASARPVERLALITPFDSMTETAQTHYPWLPVRLLLKDRYDSVSHLADYAGPLLIVRVGGDQIVPSANTDRLISSLDQPPQVLTLPKADHNTVHQHPEYGRTLADFMD